MMELIKETIMQKTIDGMREDGTPFEGKKNGDQMSFMTWDESCRI